MNHVVAVFENQGLVAGFKKLADVIENLAKGNVGQEFPEFAALEDRLKTSPEGQAAYRVAKSFYDKWQDGLSPLDAAKQALLQDTDGNGELDGVDLGKVLLADVADWLGIIDRNPPAVPVAA